MSEQLSLEVEPPLVERPPDLWRLNGLEEERHLDWLVSKDALSSETCERIIRISRQFPITAPTTVGEDRRPDRRQADMRKVGLTHQSEPLLNLLCDVAERANALAYGLDLTSINREPQYVEYRPGWGQFDWHNDYSHGVAEAPRKLTIILQLSPPSDYDGGRLELFGYDIETMPDAQGSIIVFPSIIPHRVTQVTRGCRKALVSWIAGPRIR